MSSAKKSRMNNIFENKEKIMKVNIFPLFAISGTEAERAGKILSGVFNKKQRRRV